MTKKDPVLWVVVDKNGIAWSFHLVASGAKFSASGLGTLRSANAPFRVVKYLPAPKQRRTK